MEPDHGSQNPVDLGECGGGVGYLLQGMQGYQHLLLGGEGIFVACNLLSPAISWAATTFLQSA